MEPDNHRTKPLKPWATGSFSCLNLHQAFCHSSEWLTQHFSSGFISLTYFLDPCNFIYNHAVNKPPGRRLPKFDAVWITQTEENFHSHLILLPDMYDTCRDAHVLLQTWLTSKTSPKQCHQLGNEIVKYPTKPMGDHFHYNPHTFLTIKFMVDFKALFYFVLFGGGCT